MVASPKSIHRFTGCPSRLRLNKAPQIAKDSTTLNIFMLFFLEIIQLLIEETNRYYYQYLDTLDKCFQAYAGMVA
jgi:hypothetical protein